MITQVLIVSLIVVYCAFWCGGFVSHVVLSEPPAVSRVGGAVLLFSAAALIVLAERRAHRAALVGLGVLGLLIEVVGGWTGFPFGDYAYTTALPPHLLDTPLAMGAAWLILLAYVHQRLWRLGVRGRFTIATVGALYMVTIDLLVDPVAVDVLRYWQWRESGVYYGIPSLNFLGWFAASWVLLAFAARRPTESGATRFVGLTTLLFFTALAIDHGLLIPGVVGAMLCLLDPISDVRWARSIWGVRRRLRGSRNTARLPA